MKLVDTHAHLEEVTELDAALARARQAGVAAVIAVGSDLSSNEQILEIANTYKGFVYPALGLHPGNLGDAAHVEAAFRFVELNLDRVVGIGEIGLDYHYREARKSQEVRGAQKQVFRRALSLARDSGKPALIHSRGSWLDCLAMVHEEKVTKAVFHWYSGPLEILLGLVADGYFVSATPAAEYSEGHRQALLQTPLDNLLLETDSPVVYKGQASEPSHVLRSLAAVSALKAVESEAIARATTENAARVFGIRV